MSGFQMIDKFQNPPFREDLGGCETPIQIV